MGGGGGGGGDGNNKSVYALYNFVFIPNIIWRIKIAEK